MYIIKVNRDNYIKNKKLELTKDREQALLFKQINHAKYIIRLGDLRKKFNKLHVIRLNQRKIGQR